MKSNFTILGIETSCDETAAAVLSRRRLKFEIKSNIVLSQIDIHRKFGGVVPEVAARQHLKNILPVINQAIEAAKIKAAELDLLAVTTRPGLITSLLVGIETAKTLAYVWRVPIVGVDHLEAHIYANWLENSEIKFPALSLVVSGGHTQLILMKNEYSFKIIGQTLDDAAGECFDKVAKVLGLGYPGGPIISKIAKAGNSQAIDLPRPMMKNKNFDFSFSGLKTAVLYKVKKNKPKNKKQLSDWCASFEQAVTDVLVNKTIKAAQQYQVKTILLAGGVAANQRLRSQLTESIKNNLSAVELQSPAINLCTDNAAMTAVAGYFKFKKYGGDNWQKLRARPN